MTKLWAVIPAGGEGLRYGSETPKQYSTVAGLTVLEHVLKAFLALNVFESIVVPIPSVDKHFQRLADAKHESVVSIAGGLERAESVYAGLDWIRAQGAGKNDWVFTFFLPSKLWCFSWINNNIISKLFFDDLF